MKTLTERLNDMRQNPDAWIEPEALDYAETWFSRLQRECGVDWIEPDFVNSVNSTEICVEWHCGTRKVTLYVEPEEAYALRAWDTRNTSSDIDEAQVNTPTNRAKLWKWLLLGEGVQRGEEMEHEE